jgi:hypothetical protein
MPAAPRFWHDRLVSASQRSMTSDGIFMMP